VLAVVLDVRNKQIIVRDLMHSKEKDSNEGKPLLKVQEMECLKYLQRASTTEFFETDEIIIAKWEQAFLSILTDSFNRLLCY
jgi:hypothetical protein